jgi:geranylgeranyl diphosphate synthase type II
VLGGDIRQNKKTLLFIHSMATASEENKKGLLRYYQEEDPHKVEKVLTIFESTHSAAYVLRLAEDFGQKAFRALDLLAVTPFKKEPLRQLFSDLLTRIR